MATPERLPGKWFGAVITAGIDLPERLGANRGPLHIAFEYRN